MAINKNHEFEELNGVKCGVVERDVKPERLAFLKELLEFNGFTVVAVPSPPPKAAAAAAPPKEGEISASAEASAGKPTSGEATTGKPTSAEATEAMVETYTVGVTDYTFNWVNAIFGRQLKTKDGHIVTLAYWRQQEPVSHDEIPYYEHP